jgi:hypothetical protein
MCLDINLLGGRKKHFCMNGHPIFLTFSAKTFFVKISLCQKKQKNFY